MDSRRVSLVTLNVLGGAAILASYASGLRSIPAGALWGGVPDALRPLYTLNMFAAAAGYFFFTPYIAFRLDPGTTRVAGRFDYRLFYLLYALVLIPSALWLPLTGWVVEQPAVSSFAVLRIDLALVALGSVGLLCALLALAPGAPRGRWLAIAGLVPFCLQTALLDALVWPAFFRLPTH